MTGAVRGMASPDGFEDEFRSSWMALSDDCVEALLMILEEMEGDDPDVDERCGLLEDRHEVYARRLPGCASHRLVVSLDLSGAAPHPMALHAAVPSQPTPCAAARSIAARQLKLVNPVWEPKG